MTLTCKDSSGNEIKVRTEVLTNDQGKLVVEADLLNKTISVVGIVDFYLESYQVKVFSFGDINIA